MTSARTLMAHVLDRELRARFNLCISRQSCGEIIDAVITDAAAIATRFLPPAPPPGRPPDGGCISSGVASAVASSSSADLAPSRTSGGGRAPSGAAPAVISDHAIPPASRHAIRAGDIVRHEPTGEDWVVAYVDGEYLAWCGWPAGEARLSDCRLTKSCSDEEHLDWLREIAKADGKRGRKAQMALAALKATPAPQGPSTP